MSISVTELPLLHAQTKDYLKVFSSDRRYEKRISLVQECKPIVARYLTVSWNLHIYLKSSSHTNRDIQRILKRHTKLIKKDIKKIAAFYLKYGTPDVVVNIEQFQTEFSDIHDVLNQRIQMEKTYFFPEYHRIKHSTQFCNQTQPITQALTV